MADEEKDEQWAVYSDDEGTGEADVAGGADISATAPNGTPAVSGIAEAAQRLSY
jgi:hypothetical protein